MSNAIYSPLPKYPEAALARKRSGLVVAQLQIGTDGRVKRVSILEAADDAFRQPVSSALQQWVFIPIVRAHSTERLEVDSKVAIYFSIMDGKGVVALGGEDGVDDKESAGARQPAKRITQTEWNQLRTNKAVVLIDIRSRREYESGHETMAVNIPFEEFGARAASEISKTAIPVIDCRPLRQLRTCEAAAEILVEEGWRNVLVLTDNPMAQAAGDRRTFRLASKVLPPFSSGAGGDRPTVWL